MIGYYIAACFHNSADIRWKTSFYQIMFFVGNIVKQLYTMNIENKTGFVFT